MSDYFPKPSEPRPIYGDFKPMRGTYYPDTRISKLIKQGYKGIYDARTGILTMYKEEKRMKCPYRKKTYYYSNSVEEEYMDCYETDCPFYVPMGADVDYCKKAEKETKHD